MRTFQVITTKTSWQVYYDDMDYNISRLFLAVRFLS